MRKRVEGIIVNEENKFLVGKNRNNDYFMFPGGGIEDNEDLIDACKREVIEETGYVPINLEVIHRDGDTTFCLGHIKYYSRNNYEDRMTELQFLPFEDAKQLLDTGPISDARIEALRIANGKLYEKDSIDPTQEFKWGSYKEASFHEPVLVLSREKLTVREYVEESASPSNSCFFEKKAESIVATVGQILFNAPLPHPLRDYSRVMNKKEVAKLLAKVAKSYPEQYASISKHLYSMGDNSALFDLKHLTFDDLKQPIDKTPYFDKAKKEYEKILTRTGNQDIALIDSYNKMKEELTEDAIKEAVKQKNNLAIMAYSGARGSPRQFTDITLSPVLVSDYKNKPIPIIVDRSYSQGLTPAQYFATAYGTRRGAIAAKLMVPQSGYMSKMLSWSLSNIVVTEKDCKTQNGSSYGIDDAWNIGKFLAKQTGEFAPGTLIDDRVIQSLKDQGFTHIVIRNPISCEAKKGVCSKCLGQTELGIAPIGYAAGINSAAALSEPITQSNLSEKHTGGAVKKRVGGFPLIERLVKIPEAFEGSAKVALEHGKITKIEKSPWGGWDIYVNETKHHIEEGTPPTVKEGDIVEKGDVLSEGIHNPAVITQLKGWGQGRKTLSKELRQAFEDMGNNIDRTHYEIVSRGLVNFGEAEKKVGDYLPNEIGILSDMSKNITFKDAKEVSVKEIKPFNIYLAKAVLDFMPGTEITPKVKEELIENGYTKIYVTSEKIPINPLMVRVEDTTKPDRDWVNRLSSQGLKTSLFTGVQRGDKSPIKGTSFIHPYIRGVDFGRETEFY